MQPSVSAPEYDSGGRFCAAQHNRCPDSCTFNSLPASARTPALDTTIGAEHEVFGLTVYGLDAQIAALLSTPVSGLVVSWIDCSGYFAWSFCLTAQGLDGDPIYLLDEFMRYRVELFQEAGGFIKLPAGR